MVAHRVKRERYDNWESAQPLFDALRYQIPADFATTM